VLFRLTGESLLCTEKTINNDDNSDCSKVETCVTTQENSVTQNLDLVENKDDSKSLNDDIEDKDMSNHNQNENKQSNDSPVSLNNTESNEDGHDVERNPKTSECTGGHCEKSSICNTEIAVKPGDAIKHAIVWNCGSNSDFSLLPILFFESVDLFSNTADTSCPGAIFPWFCKSIRNRSACFIASPGLTAISVLHIEEHKMEVLEQKTELSNIELLTSNDTKSDLSEIDMPDSKDSKVTPVLNNTDVTDKQLMESQLQNASNCEKNFHFMFCFT
jgi:hypothetical protein